jgi:hypothetical protein
MKKTWFLIAILNFIFFWSYSQDVITKFTGEKIVCKILKTDSLNVYFNMKQKGKMTDTYLEKSKIKSIDYVTLLPYSSNSDSIVIWKKRLYHKGQPLSNNKMVELLKTNNEAFRKYNSAKAPAVFANLLSYTGGFLIGYPIGTSIGGGDPNWTSAAIGAGMIVFAIPIELISIKNQKESINIYNNGIKRNSQIKKESKIGITRNGLTFCMKF